MRYEKLFPTLLIILDICAALAYIPTDNLRQVVYWLAAAILTTCVTY
ncbi:MAG TPA: hypothetical protein P5175_10845 [Anaerohalosphaeraceae bacterium]|nr:hypothetical protein [Anaerohalosphaeraceae bacterium]HRS72335.1 hypothetical protein [Anaerohalosphaeraceae bacterium]